MEPMKRKYEMIICLITAFINILADRITKLLAINYLRNNKSLILLNETIILSYTENDGAFLSLGNSWPIIVKYLILLIIPLIVCVIVFLYCLFKERDKIKIIILVSIVSGGISNLFDRLMNNFNVIDFMNFGIGKIRTGILNVADLSITFGVIILVIYEFRIEGKKSS